MSAKHTIKTKEHHDGGSALIFLSSPHVRRTMALGRAIGHAALDGAVISCRGDLGAGKTTLAKGIAQGLGIAESIISPTYTIISEYYGRLRFVHIDAYRLSGEDEFFQTGGEELLGAPGTLCLIEWGERISTILPPESQQITITVEESGDRLITIEGTWMEQIDWKRFAVRREVIQ